MEHINLAFSEQAQLDHLRSKPDKKAWFGLACGCISVTIIGFLTVGKFMQTQKASTRAKLLEQIQNGEVFFFHILYNFLHRSEMSDFLFHFFLGDWWKIIRWKYEILHCFDVFLQIVYEYFIRKEKTKKSRWVGKQYSYYIRICSWNYFQKNLSTRIFVILANFFNVGSF